ncbi:hypothetical protein N658DRAFT_526277 [Parathielavia hyrcaniae]|uniref:Uncharacterized protein n=1 Tax=Parathielavia hyrcaniae TaxID=113614 RepID=A0AAN6SZ56_9PEZI|nr:hypothetical protein N658DRAFT_526277 [Parathielavia hyrcaniae]
MEEASSTTMPEDLYNPSVATAATPSTPLPPPGLFPGGARRSILDLRVSRDGNSTGSLGDNPQTQNLPEASPTSPAVDMANKRARKESAAGVGAGRSSSPGSEDSNQQDGDEGGDEPIFASASRLLFRAKDLLPSSPPASFATPALAMEDGISGEGNRLEEALVGFQPLFKQTMLCFDDNLRPGRIWTPVNLRGDPDPHWREVPHNPAHPPVPGEGTCHPAALTHPDTSLPSLIHTHHARLAAQGSLFETTISNRNWAASLINSCRGSESDADDANAAPATAASDLKLRMPRRSLRQRQRPGYFVFPATRTDPFVGARLPASYGDAGEETMMIDLLRPRGGLGLLDLGEGVDVPAALPAKKEEGPGEEGEEGVDTDGAGLDGGVEGDGGIEEDGYAEE